MKLFPWVAVYFFHKNFLSSWATRIWCCISEALSHRAAFSWLNREMIRNSRKTIDGHYQDNFFDAAFKKFIFQFVVGFRRIISADRVWHLLSTTRRVSLLTTRNAWNTFRKNFNYRNLDANVKLKFQITAQKGKNSIEIRSQINIASRRFF